MRKIIVAFLIIISFVLQCTLFKGISLGGIVPNLLVILTSSFALMRGEKEGLVIGFICGFLCDIFFGNVLGLYALILMYIGYVNGKFSRIFYPEDIKLPIALIVVSDLSFGLMCYICLFLLRGRLEFGYYLKSIIMPEALYTIIATVIYYPIILLINSGLERSERKRAQKFV